MTEALDGGKRRLPNYWWQRGKDWTLTRISTNVDSSLTPNPNSNSEQTQDLTVGTELWTLRKITGVNFHDTGLKGVLRYVSKSTNNSNNKEKLDLIKIRNCLLQRTLLRKVRDNSKNGRKYLQIIFPIWG